VTDLRRRLMRSQAIRVALAAAAIVGVVYLVVAAGVVAIVTNGLTAQIDARLTQSLTRINDQPPPPPAGGFGAPDVGPRFGPQLVVWTVHPDGDVTCNDSNAVLPVAFQHATTPQTVLIGDTSMRIAGAQAGDTYVVIGQTTSAVAQAQQTVILAEAIIGPLLLLFVFLGAMAIGRRVAAPLERAHARQLEFTANASHELRTPLSVIEAQATLALAQDREPDWYRTAFERVTTESRRMHRLVDELLWLARFDAAGSRPRDEHIDLSVLATQAADRFEAVAAARRITLRVEAPSSGAVIAAPAQWIDQLFGILIDNACRYAPEGGAVEVRVAVAGSRVRLAVDDNGPGVPAEERAHIFDRFHRASTRPGGSGLGLAIGDAIVRATGGHWHVDASPTGGASMGVGWPRAGQGAG
jgi:signal transduction histidine kinase